MVIILFKGSGAGIKTYTIKRIYVGLAFLLDALELKSYTERLIGRKANSSQIQRLIFGSLIVLITTYDMIAKCIMQVNESVLLFSNTPYISMVA